MPLVLSLRLVYQYFHPEAVRQSMANRNSSVLTKPKHTNAPGPRGWVTGLSAPVEESRDAFHSSEKDLNLWKSNPAGERLLGQLIDAVERWFS